MTYYWQSEDEKAYSWLWTLGLDNAYQLGYCLLSFWRIHWPTKSKIWDLQDCQALDAEICCPMLGVPCHLNQQAQNSHIKSVILCLISTVHWVTIQDEGRRRGCVGLKKEPWLTIVQLGYMSVSRPSPSGASNWWPGRVCHYTCDFDQHCIDIEPASSTYRSLYQRTSWLGIRRYPDAPASDDGMLFIAWRAGQVSRNCVVWDYSFLKTIRVLWP